MLLRVSCSLPGVCNDERDWAYIHDFQIRDSDICAGYAFPRGTGLPRSGVSASQRGNEAQDYRGEMTAADLPLYPHGVGLYESSLQLAIFILKPLG
jgi:hypothetical protein